MKETAPTEETGWERLDRIERMLKWLVFSFQTEFNFKQMSEEQRQKLERLVENCPDISDILKETK